MRVRTLQARSRGNSRNCDGVERTMTGLASGCFLSAVFPRVCVYVPILIGNACFLGGEWVAGHLA